MLHSRSNTTPSMSMMSTRLFSRQRKNLFGVAYRLYSFPCKADQHTARIRTTYTYMEINKSLGLSSYFCVWMFPMQKPMSNCHFVIVVIIEKLLKLWLICFWYFRLNRSQEDGLSFSKKASYSRRLLYFSECAYWMHIILLKRKTRLDE